MAPSADYGSTVPHLAFMIFQCMFAVITPALITGAFAERMNFGAFLLFTVLWVTFVYSPLAHWVWGVGGWLGGLGALDFAGGTVVHISSAASALAASLFIGKRLGYGTRSFIPHNLPMTVTGAALLWFGWFGFNAGSALACNGLAAGAFVATHISSAAAALSWTIIEWFHRGKPTTLGAASGAVAGLVAVTPAAGFVGPMSALAIGAAGGLLCYGGVMVKSALGYDDSLDVVGIHGVGGAWGALATGLFASTAVNPDGADGLFFGNPAQVWLQFVSIIATAAFAFLSTLVILKAVDLLLGVRMNGDEEERGMDITLHNEAGYNF
jgi:Amt family ammonium transporter